MPYGPQLPDKPGRINIKDGMLVPDPAGVGWQAKRRALQKQGITPPKDPTPAFRMTEEEQARAAAEALDAHRKGEGPLRMKPPVPLGQEPPPPSRTRKLAPPPEAPPKIKEGGIRKFEEDLRKNMLKNMQARNKIEPKPDPKPAPKAYDRAYRQPLLQPELPPLKFPPSQAPSNSKTSPKPAPAPEPEPAPAPPPRAGRPGMTQSDPVPPMDEGPQPGFRNAGTTYLKQNIIPYYGGPGAADKEIEAALQARRDRPANIDMSGFGDWTKEDYLRPQPHDWEDPLGHFAQKPNTEAYHYRKPGMKYGSIHFNQEKFPDWQNSRGYHDVLTHERTHGAMHDDPGSPSLMSSPRGDTNSPYVTSKPEISARTGEIRRMFTHYTGKSVRTHEDALEAMHWYLQNHQKMLDDNHYPTAGPETVNEYLTLPGVEREKVLQRMLEVAGTDRIRGSLLG